MHCRVLLLQLHFQRGNNLPIGVDALVSTFCERLAALDRVFDSGSFFAGLRVQNADLLDYFHYLALGFGQ